MTTSLHILFYSLFNNHHTTWFWALSKSHNRNSINANSENSQPLMSHVSTRWKWVVSSTIHQLYPCQKDLHYPLNRKLGGSHNCWSGFFQEKIFLSLPASTIPWLSSLYTSHYKKYAIPPPFNFIMPAYIKRDMLFVVVLNFCTKDFGIYITFLQYLCGHWPEGPKQFQQLHNHERPLNVG